MRPSVSWSARRGRLVAGACSRVSLLVFLLVLAGLGSLGEARAQDGFQPVPPLAGPVVDRVGVLSAGARKKIEALALELEQKTGAEMAVLIVETTAPEDVFDYGMRVAETWELGKQGRDDGLLLVIATGDRKLHFLTGYGLEGILPDGRLGRIRDAYLVPAFRAGDFDAGVSSALRAAAEVIAADAGVTLSGEPARPPRSERERERGIGPAGLLFLLAFFLLPLLRVLRGGRRRRRGYAPILFGGGLGGGGGGGGGGAGGWGGGCGGGCGGGGGFGGGGAGGSW